MLPLDYASPTRSQEPLAPWISPAPSSTTIPSAVIHRQPEHAPLFITPDPYSITQLLSLLPHSHSHLNLNEAIFSFTSFNPSEMAAHLGDCLVNICLPLRPQQPCKGAGSASLTAPTSTRGYLSTHHQLGTSPYDTEKGRPFDRALA